MKNKIKRSSLLRVAVCLLAAAAFTVPVPGFAQLAEQVIELENGWNAVWLEVEPVSTNGLPLPPEEVFTDPAVTQVFSPRLVAGTAEFFGDAPSSNSVFRTFNQEGWTEWNRNSSVDDEDRLALIFGNRPYLINSDAAISITVTGEVEFFRPTWIPDRYNLVGFGLDPANPPTFEEFFSPSGTRHPADMIYALQPDGNWQPVSSTDPMENDEAYWVFSRGNSHYMGPVAVSFNGDVSGSLSFGGPIDSEPVDNGAGGVELLDLEEIVFSNLAANNAAVPGLSLRPNLAFPSQFADDLELFPVEPQTNALGYVLAGQGLEAGLDAVEPRSSSYLTIGAKRNWTAGQAERINLYRLTTGAGSEFWLPIHALQNDLQLSGVLPPAVPGEPSPHLSGLWVGEVIVDEVTSIVVDGAPSQPAAGSAPLRILLHSDTNGVVQLLSQVTLMQTRTADPAVEAEPVLVVDPAQIPFFEGIKERRGKRVGLRLESVAFDMPRRLDINAQAELVAAATNDLPDAAAILDYLVSQGTRPPKLEEAYHRAWGLEGSLGAGQTVGTAAPEPLNLDPFHRSNPFRHAFHQQHPRGPNITRELEIVFDAEPSVPGLLRGRYRETIRGLIKGPLKLNGLVELRRVSAVGVLEGGE